MPPKALPVVCPAIGCTAQVICQDASGHKYCLRCHTVCGAEFYETRHNRAVCNQVPMDVRPSLRPNGADPETLQALGYAPLGAPGAAMEAQTPAEDNLRHALTVAMRASGRDEVEQLGTKVAFEDAVGTPQLPRVPACVLCALFPTLEWTHIIVSENRRKACKAIFLKLRPRYAAVVKALATQFETRVAQLKDSESLALDVTGEFNGSIIRRDVYVFCAIINHVDLLAEEDQEVDHDEVITQWQTEADRFVGDSKRRHQMRKALQLRKRPAPASTKSDDEPPAKNRWRCAKCQGRHPTRKLEHTYINAQRKTPACREHVSNLCRSFEKRLLRCIALDGKNVQNTDPRDEAALPAELRRSKRSKMRKTASGGDPLKAPRPPVDVHQPFLRM